MKLTQLLGLVGAVILVSGCAPRQPAPATGSGGHAHAAPHGGTLVEIGDHAYNLELVHDPAEGRLTAYVLDGHAENFVRIAAPTIEIVAIAGGERRPLTLNAVANAATGETVGNTSQFEVQADWLEDSDEFPGTLTTIEIKGSRFDNVALYLR